LNDYFAGHENHSTLAGLYDRVLTEIERPLLLITLDKCHGNQLRAATILGLNRNTLRKKIRKLGLKATKRKKKTKKVAND
jgi:two-component system, NtrC family, nitrogen regulation response regulator GlnG